MSRFPQWILVSADANELREAQLSWSEAQWSLYRALRRKTYEEIIDRLLTRRPMNRCCCVEYGSAYMRSRVGTCGNEIHIVMLFVDFENPDDDPDPGESVGLDALGFDGHSAVSLVFVTGNIWTLEQIEGDPIFSLNFFSFLSINLVPDFVREETRDTEKTLNPGHSLNDANLRIVYENGYPFRRLFALHDHLSPIAVNPRVGPGVTSIDDAFNGVGFYYEKVGNKTLGLDLAYTNKNITLAVYRRRDANYGDLH